MRLLFAKQKRSPQLTKWRRRLTNLASGSRPDLRAARKLLPTHVSYNAPQVTRVSNKRSIALGGKRIPFVGCLDPLDLSITFDPTFSKSNVVNVVLVARERKIRPRKWRRWRTFRYRRRKGRKNEAGLPRSL